MNVNVPIYLWLSPPSTASTWPVTKFPAVRKYTTAPAISSGVPPRWAGVFWIIRRNWTQRTFPLAAFLAVALFEALVNVLYMANRAAVAATGAVALSRGLKIFFAAHGAPTIHRPHYFGLELRRGRLLEHRQNVSNVGIVAKKHSMAFS